MRTFKSNFGYLSFVFCFFFFASVSVANAGFVSDFVFGLFRKSETTAAKVTTKGAEKNAIHTLGEGVLPIPQSSYVVSQLARIAAKCVAYSSTENEDNQQKELRCNAAKNQFLQCVSVKTKEGLTEDGASDFCAIEENVKTTAPMAETVPIKTIQEALREDKKTKSYFTLSYSYRKKIGKSIPKVRATISGELTSTTFMFPQIANEIEQSQIWVWVSPNINLVFHNSTGKSLDGLVVKLFSDECAGDTKKNQFRLITFESEVKPDYVVAADFRWDSSLPRLDGHCAKIVDVIFK